MGELVKLARLRNLLVHRYWIVDDERMISEARSGGLHAIRAAIDDIRGFTEG